MQCYHCGREVFPTEHAQKSYRVDYYRQHTGHTEWEILVNPKPDAPPFRYRKLIHPIDVFTCVQCYGQPEIRRLMDDDFAGRRELAHTAPSSHLERSIIDQVDPSWNPRRNTV